MLRHPWLAPEWLQAQRRPENQHDDAELQGCETKQTLLGLDGLSSHTHALTCSLAGSDVRAKTDTRHVCFGLCRSLAFRLLQSPKLCIYFSKPLACGGGSGTQHETSQGTWQWWLFDRWAVHSRVTNHRAGDLEPLLGDRGC